MVATCVLLGTDRAGRDIFVTFDASGCGAVDGAVVNATEHTVGPSVSPSQSLSMPSHVSGEGVAVCSQVKTPSAPQRWLPTPHAPARPVEHVPASGVSAAALPAHPAYPFHWQLALHERFEVPQSPHDFSSTAPGAHTPSLEHAPQPPHLPSFPHPRDWVPQFPQLWLCPSPGLHCTWPAGVMNPPVK